MGTNRHNMGICNAEEAPEPLKNKAFVGAQLVEKGFTICKEGSISAEDMDSKKLIDNHYYAIASKATILKPSELNIPEDKFEAKFEGKEPCYVFNGFSMEMRSKY